MIVGVSSARANHIPGALYNGTHSGGGSVEFRLSPDGATVTGFTIVTDPGSSCFFVPLGRLIVPDVPIGDFFFSYSNGAFSLSGSFPAPQTAAGTFTFPNYGCNNVNWTARTTASPPNDTTPPDTTIAAGPSGPTNKNAPTFTFTSTESGGTFECRIDDGAFVACSSPFKTASLTDGSHTFEVKATDKAGNHDASPALRTFDVDTTAPETTIKAGPTGKTTNRTPRFAFRSSEAGSTFRCRLDGRRWVACGSPKQYARTSAGRHVFDVQASDSVGNRDPSPAHRPFTVVTH